MNKIKIFLSIVFIIIALFLCIKDSNKCKAEVPRNITVVKVNYTSGVFYYIITDMNTGQAYLCADGRGTALVKMEN
jgi:hypothetical protein